MNEKEISEYIKTHEKLINGALKIMRGRVPFEDIEDARQELYIVMIKCLRNYDPEKGPLENYINSSLKNRRNSYFEAYINKASPSLGKGKRAQLVSMNDIGNEGDEYLSDSIEDERELLKKLDAQLINDDLMKGLSPDIRIMVKLWAGGCTLKEIGSMMQPNRNYETVRLKIAAALEEMRTLVDDEKRSKRLI